MIRARAIAVTVLLVSYGALGARQPAVRTSIPLPVPAEQLAATLGLTGTDRSHLMISIIRLLFDAPDGQSTEDQKLRRLLEAQMRGDRSSGGDLVPLPLDTSIWRETLLQTAVKDTEIAASILSDRNTALLYHGLAALDDETLGWLGADRETLVHLRRNAGIFATFGRSIVIRGDRVLVPGEPDTVPIWTAIVGANPSRPSAFVQRLIRGDGRLAWFFDTLVHLDVGRQRLTLGASEPEALRSEHVRELLDVFEAVAPEWHIPDRPFVRPVVDPSLVLSLVRAKPGGELVGPTSRPLWELVFRDAAADNASVDAVPELPQDKRATVDVAWLTRRISLAPAALGRRRLETFLFAQRVFPKRSADEASTVGALRGAAAFPALALTLERSGIPTAEVLAAATRAATALNGIKSAHWRRVAVAQFQASLAIIDRVTRAGSLDRDAAETLTSSLLALPISAGGGYEGALVTWLQRSFASALSTSGDSASPLEDAVLRASAGVRPGARLAPSVEWEGRRYRIDPAAAELGRLQRVRERQRAAMRATVRTSGTLDAALAAAARGRDIDDPARWLQAEQTLAETLISIVYAMYLGEPAGAAVSAGDVAARHDFGLSNGNATANSAWRLPHEQHGGRTGWHVVGSLLGLDTALARLALRRLDLGDMPLEPTLPAGTRMTATLTAALFSPTSLSDATRDEIAAAIGRGRARVEALRGDPAEVERTARAAGFSEWRRQALGWTVEHERDRALSRFSLIELFWLGAPRSDATGTVDDWGTATLLLDGCLCLRMPGPQPWEWLAGRSSTGYLGTRGADVAMRVAELLVELALPASLAPGIVAHATQDIIDGAHPAFPDDWPAFERAVRDLPRARLIDYIAAAAADGALVPLTASDAHH